MAQSRKCNICCFWLDNRLRS